jgi:type IV pilus assembly protein PilY1
VGLLLLTITVGGTAQAQAVDIATAPLFLSPSVEPNIMFILDDSGSMQWETMPDELTNMFSQPCCTNYMMWMYPRTDGLHGADDYSNGFRVPSFNNDSIMGRAFRSSRVNTLYYNPAITYRPWANADGSDMLPANPAAAPNRPLLEFAGFGTRNLTANNTQTARWVENRANAHVNESRTFYPAVYSTYIGPAVPNVLAAIADAGSPIWTNANYNLTEIRDTTPTYTGEGRGNRSDCANATAIPPSCTYAEEIQNFANWYTYHRNRIFTARGGIGHAFVDFGAEMRVGYARINTNENTVDNIAGRAVVRGVRLFEDTLEDAPKTAFFNSLYTDPIPAQGTPLRRALDGAGQYFSRTDARGPWSTTPGAAGGNDLTCRQSFSILMTDGYTSGGDDNRAYHADRRANTDGSIAQNTTNVHPDDATLNFTYTPSNPYQDTRSNTLADVAMYYWKRDLRSDLANRVPTSTRDEAFWQHMVTYGVGLGVAGSINPADAWQAVANNPPTPIAWPDPAFGTTNCGDGPAGTCAARVDDLLHAAVNSRGGFFSAADPDTFATELRGVLEDIVGRVESSATSAAASAAVLQTDTLLYTAGFRSDDWSGTLTAYELTEDGTGSEAWDAEALLAVRSPATRKIFTRAAAGSGVGGGVAFQWGNLHDDQKAALNHDPDNVEDNLGQERLAWLRGDEEAHDSFRSRSESGQKRLLGDIIHSDPQYKNDVLYLGANDGMLHAFDAITGEELFAYIPSPLLLPESGQDHAPLSRLMDPNYLHRYFVDGKAVVAAVNIGGAKTYLVGTMGAGGRAVFALDVTNPGNFSASDVKWEFAHPELGYNVGQPAIVRMSDGTWAAVFGNGYNSNSGRAALFVVNLETGALIKIIETNADPANGLASPFVTDWPEMNLRAQRIYAGDLLGNLWAFDVPGASNDWRSRKLFEARDANGAPQPITSRPHGAKIGEEQVMIVFGTGSYFRSPDATDTQIQSLYGIIDHAELPEPAVNYPLVVRPADLLQQRIITQTSAQGYTVRVLSKHRVVEGAYIADPSDPNDPNAPYDPNSPKEGGWFIDLNTETGERVISGPTTLGQTEQRVRFTTVIPDEDPCGTGRRGFLMDIDLLTGGRTSSAVFDLNDDGSFDEGDMINVVINDQQVPVPVSGIGFGSGEAIAVIAVPEPSDNLGPYDLICDGEGNCEKGRPDDLTGGRQSWRQLR